MDITIKALSGKQHVYQLESDSKVRDVKGAIEERESIDYERIKLLFGGKQLNDNMTLESYDIKTGSTIIMALNMMKSKPLPNMAAASASMGNENNDAASLLSGAASELIHAESFNRKIEEKMRKNQENTLAFGSKSAETAPVLLPEPIIETEKSVSSFNEFADDATVESKYRDILRQRLNDSNDTKSSAKTFDLNDKMSTTNSLHERLEQGIEKKDHDEDFSTLDAIKKETIDSLPTQSDTALEKASLLDGSHVDHSHIDKMKTIDDGVGVSSNANDAEIEKKKMEEDLFYVDDPDLIIEEDSSSLKKKLIPIAFGVIIIAVTISLAVFFLRVPEKEPTSSPTTLPTVDTSIPINVPLLEFLIFNNISKEEDLNAVDSPQHQALLWLWDQSEKKTNIVQQFALATLLNGLGASALLGSNLNQSECSWNTIECDDNITISGVKLGNLNLDGTILTEIGHLSNLTKFDISSNSVGGTIPNSIGSSILLEVFDVRSNRLTGTIPESLANLNLLKEFEISGNLLVGELPSGMWKLDKLERMFINANHQLIGTIPKAISNLTSLKYIDLTFTDMTGMVPSEIGSLSTLEMLQLGDSDYGGTIPTEFGNLQNLEFMYFGYTNLFGSFPTELGGLQNLEKLIMKGNNFSGEIPTEFGNLENIRDIWIEDEFVSGSIPHEMSMLKNLANVYICETQLTGSIPTEWCELNSTIRSSLECSCCRRCQ